ncbi:hypothetical protein G7K_1502-t1 [Saitoella complicata NRRL Y-17804]|uniref:Uncharacterized protein n=1 Tax=Saitoella complicata (strain BCRC 22490 / CBS 7301 / JCM 7358 / NBRC 10748 / NRRL Y-17804) TaxID=698492 RepID=A0A0E9NBV6_SAICN|nr:hypothetical protein G7K_1502-t1 [Saitoella complicata NRRL Y-17804]
MGQTIGLSSDISSFPRDKPPRIRLSFSTPAYLGKVIPNLSIDHTIDDAIANVYMCLQVDCNCVKRGMLKGAKSTDEREGPYGLNLSYSLNPHICRGHVPLTRTQTTNTISPTHPHHLPESNHHKLHLISLSFDVLARTSQPHIFGPPSESGNVTANKSSWFVVMRSVRFGPYDQAHHLSPA